MINDIRTCLKHRCDCEPEYSLYRIEKWFYTFKAIICLLLNREPNQYRYGDFIYVATIRGGVYYPPSEPTVYWAEWQVVGIGLFKNWWAMQYSDSD